MEHSNFIQTIWKLIVPFLVGFCIAFVLNIITKQLENTLLKNSNNKRMFSFIITLILLFAFIILICFIVGPELVHSIKEIIRLAPNAYDQFIQTLKDNRNIMNGSFKNMIDSIISLDIDLSSSVHVPIVEERDAKLSLNLTSTLDSASAAA